MPKLAGLAIKYKSALSSGMTRLSLFLSSGLFDLFNEKRIFPSDPSYGGGQKPAQMDCTEVRTLLCRPRANATCPIKSKTIYFMRA